MHVKEAIEAAKSYVRDIYDASEQVSDLSLEEVEFDPAKNEWLVTVEFSRPISTGFRTRAREIVEATGGAVTPRRRVQKVVVVSDEDRSPIAMRNREAA